MFRTITIAVCAFSLAALATAQQAASTPADLEKRIHDLEARVAQMQQSAQLDEIKREIDILSQEIEALKNNQQRKAVEADVQQYGLGAAASKVYRAEPGVSFGGYGEFAYAKPEHGLASADVTRAVLYTGYKFSSR